MPSSCSSENFILAHSQSLCECSRQVILTQLDLKSAQIVQDLHTLTEQSFIQTVRQKLKTEHAS